jgi:protein TonB
LEGTVTVFFVIKADGRIVSARVSKSSGSDLLDDAALDTLNRLGRFKPIPAGIGRNRWPLRVPIRFALE